MHLTVSSHGFVAKPASSDFWQHSPFSQCGCCSDIEHTEITQLRRFSTVKKHTIQTWLILFEVPNKQMLLHMHESCDWPRVKVVLHMASLSENHYL